MKLKIEDEKFDSLKQGFKRDVTARPGLIIKALEHGASAVLQQAKKNVSGPVLSLRTGRLRRSIMAGRALKQGDTFSIWVGNRLKSGSQGVNYGAVWEFGSGPAVIRPIRARALRWFGPGGRPIFASMVRRPAQAPRPWLGPAVKDNILKIEDLLDGVYSHEQA
ncbi:MAG: HK97 gp10 family phage protein [Deltaproteobacteria bacterium]|nr:HK97 gp10 family phage protein [Deltaproteobacteria bacterium]MBW2084719.1 HK97 gp10 family phage protein [Deltaproteobacteria bacterium]